MKKLCILTYGRTGSSAVIRMAQQNFANAQAPEQAYRRIFAVSEIFDENYAKNSDEAYADYGFMFPHMHRITYSPDPQKNLAQFTQLAEEFGASVFMCKIVIGAQHWLDKTLADCIRAMPDFKYVFLTRNLLDCYISNKKAVASNKWARFDTTGIKVDVDLDELYRLDNWCNDCVSACSKLCRIQVLDYKELFHENEPNIAAFNRMLNTNFGDTTEYLNYKDKLDMPPKQDRAACFRNAIQRVI